MKTFYSILVVMLSSAATLSHAVDESSVVKVGSRFCNDVGNIFKGSGTLFKINNEVYVISSEHVVLHGSDDICHYVSNAVLPATPADLVQADWGKGLALLKLKNPLPRELTDKLPDFSDFTEALPAKNDELNLIGFAMRSGTVMRGRRASILASDSNRAYIPLQDALLEIQGGHIEPGMSGGALVDSQTGKFYGVITHQGLKPIAGSAYEIVDISERTPESDHSFVIATKDVIFWVRAVLRGDSPSFVRDSSSQVLGSGHVVYAGGLSFEIWNSKNAKNGAVGGVDGTGAGGIDGTGAGGNTPSPRVKGSCVSNHNDPFVEITRDFAEHKASWGIASQLAWKDRVSKRIKSNDIVCIPYFLKYHADTNQMIPVKFYSLEQFMRYLNSDLQPFAILKSETSSMSIDTVISKITDDAKELAPLADKLARVAVEKRSQPLSQLCGQLKVLSHVAQNWAQILDGDREDEESEQQNTINIKWLKSLDSEAYKAGWSAGFNAEFETTVEALTLVKSINDTLAKVLVK